MYIPGRLLGGADALSRYGVRHCTEETAQQVARNSSPSAKQHLTGLLAAASNTETELTPFLIDEDEHLITSLSTDIRPVTWEEIKNITGRDPNMQSLVRLVRSSFPTTKEELTPELQQYWGCRKGLSVYDGVLLFNERIVIPPSVRTRVLRTLHSAHQGVTGMVLRAELSVFWPGMTRDIRDVRSGCTTCHTIAPSQANMPPIQPITPAYPFQHICADYFTLHGLYFGVIVDRFSNWFNVYKGTGGAACLVNMLTRLFQDVGVPDTITSDGGPEFKSEKLKDLLQQYGVHHRLTSVGFAHANTRAELAVKTAKRLLRENISPSGDLETAAVTRAVLQYRNTPDRDTGLSPTYLLLGRQLRDFLPAKPNQLPPVRTSRDLSSTWQEVAEWRELALAKRSTKNQENLSAKVKEHTPLALGDHVMIQNQVGNNPTRWNKRGVVVAILPHRQ